MDNLLNKMDIEKIKEIIDLMEKRELAEFEYEEGGKRLKLRKNEQKVAIGHAPAVVAPNSTPVQNHDGVKELATNLEEIKSPLVGTFYRSPKPGSPPFVNVGDEVSSDKVLCIIESMKVMNEIKGQSPGFVKEIKVKDGQAVQYGEVLFVVEKK